jgi:hypothetical protein
LVCINIFLIKEQQKQHANRPALLQAVEMNLKQGSTMRLLRVVNY